MTTMTRTSFIDSLERKKNTLSTMGFFQRIPFPALQIIEKTMVEKKFVRRESIFLEHERALFIWFVKQGHVKEVNHSEDGNDLTLSMVGAGGMFGISSFNGGDYGFHSIAETDVTVLSFPVLVFRDNMEKYPSLALAVVSKISQILTQSRDAQTFSQECAEKRLLHILIKMSAEFGKYIPLTRKEIASMAGTSMETCIRTFSRLGAAGLIKTEPGKLTIENLENLKNRMRGL